MPIDSNNFVNKNKQTTPDDTKQTQHEKQAEVGNSSVDFVKFSNLFPKKVEQMQLEDIPEYVNLVLLAEKIKESEFLQECNNLNLAWCCQKNNYEKIINDKYKGLCQSNKPVKNNFSYEIRNYTEAELEGFFTDINEVSI